MKTYTFEYTDDNLIKKTVILSMLTLFTIIGILFLLLRSLKNMNLDEEIVYPVLLTGLALTIFFAFWAIKRLIRQFKKVKLTGAATILDDHLELKLNNLVKTIYFKNLKGYKTEVHQHGKTVLKLMQAEKTDYLYADNMYCNATDFNLFCKDLDEILSTYKTSKSAELRERSMNEKPWFLYLLFIITVLIISLIIFTEIASPALFAALAAVWSAYFGTKSLRHKN